MNPDGGTLATIASVISAFGSTALLFRVQRENDMRSKQERVWLPVADWLLMIATLASLLFVLVPVAAGLPLVIPATASVISSICVAGYIPSILAHYRIVFGGARSGPRSNPEPLELAFVLATVAIALSFSGWLLCRAQG